MVHCYRLAMMRSHINCFYYSVVVVCLFSRAPNEKNALRTEWKRENDMHTTPNGQRGEKLFHFILYLMNTMLVRCIHLAVADHKTHNRWVPILHAQTQPRIGRWIENWRRQCSSEKMRKKNVEKIIINSFVWSGHRRRSSDLLSETRACLGNHSTANRNI